MKVLVITFFDKTKAILQKTLDVYWILDFLYNLQQIIETSLVIDIIL